jgi:Domain of unknown function (DUF892)
MPACSRQPRRSSITKFRAMARCGRGRRSSACRIAAELLEATLQEEKATDEALTKIAETVVNQEAQAAACIMPGAQLY